MTKKLSYYHFILYQPKMTLMPDANVIGKDTKTPDEKSQVKKLESESEPLSSHNEEKKIDQSSRYNKQEHEDSLTVIKKIMNMEAADPFNVPVNPEALRIPVSVDIHFFFIG